MDPAGLPTESFPGRREAIQHSGKIDKKAFLISTGIFFGSAILCAFARLAIRVFRFRDTRWDDALVLFATMTLAVAFSACLEGLDALYLAQAMQGGKIFPLPEEIPVLLKLSQWSTIFGFTNWTTVYMVKFAFQYFFYPLIYGMSKNIVRLYWTTVGVAVVSWLYTIVNPIIICPHFGAEAAKCSSNPHQHVRSMTGDLLVACLDIVCDLLIVSLPLVILNQAMMPFTRKLSLAAMLCLSVAMVICALIRLIGTASNTTPNGIAAAPVWDMYWSMIEGCISLIMTSVIVIRGAFITQVIHDDRRKQESLLQRLGRRLLSTLRSVRSSRSSRRSPPRSSSDRRTPNASTPKIESQDLTRATLNGVRTYIGGSHTRIESEDDVGNKTMDTGYALEDLNGHDTRRD